MNDTTRELVDALNDAHDVIGELMDSPFIGIDWPQLAAYLGNESWVGLKDRIDAALARAQESDS